ncbi:MAG: hypothetical protein JW723_15210 [Bacteroidales bacterium]|nr:hypothetical protein [Bacteroidales bacterium]
MKTLTISLIFFFLAGSIAMSQKAIVIKEDSIDLKHGTIPGFITAIPEVAFETINDSWIKSLEQGTRSKVQKDGGELSIFGAIIKEITPNPVNIYGYVKDADTVTIVAAAYELKKDEYITPDKHEQSALVRQYLLTFAKDLYLDLAKNELRDKEKDLKNLENELSSVEGEKNKLDKMIKSNNNSINSINDELLILRTNLSSLNEELLIQNNQLNSLDEGPAKEEKEKYIKDLEKNIKKTNNDIESDEKKLVDLRSEIEKAQVDEIPENLKEQQRIKIAIDQQEEVVRVATEKYNTIRDY